jgi:hypothetical protein
MCINCNPCTTCNQQECICSDTPIYSDLGCVDYPSFKCVQLKDKTFGGQPETFPCLGIQTPNSLYDLLQKLETWKCNYNILAEQVKLSTDPCNPLVYGSDGGITLSIPILIQCMQDQGCSPCGGGSTCACSAPEQFGVIFDGRGLLNPNTYRVVATWQDAVCTPTVTYDFDYKLSSSSTWINYSVNQLANNNSSLIVTGGQTYDFRLRAKGNSGQCVSNYIYILNNLVSSCTAPSNASFNSTNVTLNWTSTSGQASSDFIIETRKDNESIWGLITTAVVESPASSGNYSVDLSSYSFTPDFVYHFRISNICGSNGNIISASGTGCAYDCVIANQSTPVVSNIGTSSAQINWTFATGATGYTITVNNGIPFNVGNVNQYVVTGLPSDTLATVKVSPQCAGVSGVCSGKTVSFTTQTNSCPIPIELIIT